MVRVVRACSHLKVTTLMYTIWPFFLMEIWCLDRLTILYVYGAMMANACVFWKATNPMYSLWLCFPMES